MTGQKREQMNSLFGMNIIESAHIKPVARVVLSDKCPCSDVVRSDFNAWLAEQFGTYFPVYFIGGDTVCVHPSQIAMLKM